mmetsp:Transcript_50352/g.119254  ORF Transcript_50352/g.119254 Transcript_50352/m.119254 type:complete len:250 (-) Transcript_50352:6-755(-)
MLISATTVSSARGAPSATSCLPSGERLRAKSSASLATFGSESCVSSMSCSSLVGTWKMRFSNCAGRLPYAGRSRSSSTTSLVSFSPSSGNETKKKPPRFFRTSPSHQLSNSPSSENDTSTLSPSRGSKLITSSSEREGGRARTRAASTHSTSSSPRYLTRYLRPPGSASRTAALKNARSWGSTISTMPISAALRTAPPLPVMLLIPAAPFAPVTSMVPKESTRGLMGKDASGSMGKDSRRQEWGQGERG